jgi:hypothetical protein
MMKTSYYKSSKNRIHIGGRDEEIDERTSSPVSPAITAAAISHVAVSHASAIGTAIGNANGGWQSQVILKSIYRTKHTCATEMTDTVGR